MQRSHVVRRAGAPAHAQASAFDQALTLLMADEIEAALRWSAAALERDPSAPLGLFVTSRLLARMGRMVAADEALRLALRAAVRARDLPLSLIAANDLAKVGDGGLAERAELADAFASSEPSREDDGDASNGAERETLRPLSPFLEGDELAARASAIVRAAHRAEPHEATPASLEAADLPPIFRGLSRDALLALLDAIEPVIVADGERVFNQGEHVTGAFVVAHGEIEIARRAPRRANDASVMAQLTSGALFGELAVLGPIPSPTTAVATRPSILLRLDRAALDRLAESKAALAHTIASRCRRQAVANLACLQPLVAALPAPERAALVDALRVRRFEPGAKLVTEKEESSGLHLIAVGAVEVSSMDGEDRVVLARLGAGCTVGEVETLLWRRAEIDATATEPTSTLFLARGAFDALARRHALLLQQLYGLAVDTLADRTRLVSESSVEVPESCVVEEAPANAAVTESASASEAPPIASTPPPLPLPSVAPVAMSVAMSIAPPAPSKSNGRPALAAAVGAIAVGAIAGALLVRPPRTSASSRGDSAVSEGAAAKRIDTAAPPQPESHEAASASSPPDVEVAVVAVADAAAPRSSASNARAASAPSHRANRAPPISAAARVRDFGGRE